MQRARLDWLREGDRNTRFFHSKAVWRARKNNIKKLRDDNGQWHSNRDTMGAMATDYFSKLFEADPSIVPSPVIDLFEEQITPEMNEKLCGTFTDKEIFDAFLLL
jgi:hypothetical protein